MINTVTCVSSSLGSVLRTWIIQILYDPASLSYSKLIPDVVVNRSVS